MISGSAKNEKLRRFIGVILIAAMLCFVLTFVLCKNSCHVREARGNSHSLTDLFRSISLWIISFGSSLLPSLPKRRIRVPSPKMADVKAELIE
jgi:hypothetical protein